MMRRLLLALFLVLPLPVLAQTTALSADQQIALLMKILTYDRQFEKKAKGQVLVGVVYLESDQTSLAALEGIGQALFAAKTKKVKTLGLGFLKLAYTTTGEMEKIIKEKGVNVLYVTPGFNAKQLSELIRISQANQMTSTTGFTDYVDKGIAVGVGMERNKPQIVINLPASKSEGSEFDAQLLQMAKVTRK
jgi:hypothetical protein